MCTIQPFTHLHMVVDAIRVTVGHVDPKIQLRHMLLGHLKTLVLKSDLDTEYMNYVDRLEKENIFLLLSYLYIRVRKCEKFHSRNDTYKIFNKINKGKYPLIRFAQRTKKLFETHSPETYGLYGILLKPIYFWY